MKDKILFELSGVSYSYLNKYAALKSVDLHIMTGEHIALLGANGSGKSTLLLMLAGLVFPDEGRIKFLGDTLSEKKFSDCNFYKLFRARVGIIFQNPDIQLFNSNVRDEIMFGLLQLGLSNDEMEERFEESASLMAIKHLMNRHPQYLSIGEKKRVAITSVLAMRPDIILLDEPTAGLDPRTTHHLIGTIGTLNKNGKTVITATQDIHIVREIADRAVVLSEEKRIVKDDSISEVLKDGELLEKHNLIHSHIHVHKGKPHVHPHEHPDHHHSR